MDKKVGKFRNQDSNPCIEESDGSQKCLGANNYDTSMCTAYFMRYKKCRKYWVNKNNQSACDEGRAATFKKLESELSAVSHVKHSIMLQRRQDGVTPNMPAAAERQEMLAAGGGKPY